jgi:hypothetical protein
VRVKFDLAAALGQHEVGEPSRPTVFRAGRLNHLAGSDRLFRRTIIGVVVHS